MDKALRAFLDDESVRLPRPLLTAVVRREIESLRAAMMEGGHAEPPEDAMEPLRQKLMSLSAARIQPVINATGVLIHTNMGRSPLSPQAMQTAAQAACGYSNLELDLVTGKRGKRGEFAEEALACLCGAEAATVVNNCASALVLVLRALAKGEANEVVISRGELVEIGGGFRVPDIMETSGARLREIGATNRTHLDDYRRAISPRTAMLLKVHRSNFYMRGFVESPAAEDLAALAREHGLPMVEDLGSGAMIDTRSMGAAESEPTPAQCIASGMDLVCFSGDKLLGGPQAGIIAGKKELVERLKRDPFFRALRCDKIVLALLQETAAAYLDSMSAEKPQPPDVRLAGLASASLESLKERSARIIAAISPSLKARTAETVNSESRFGGGTMPQSGMPSVAIRLDLKGGSLEAFGDALRRCSPPVIGHAGEEAFFIELRTVLPEQDETLANALKEALGA